MVTLLVWFCTTTAMTDCQVEPWGQWEGERAMISCEIAKDALLEGAGGKRPMKLNRRVRVECEQDSPL